MMRLGLRSWLGMLHLLQINRGVNITNPVKIKNGFVSIEFAYFAPHWRDIYEGLLIDVDTLVFEDDTTFSDPFVKWRSL